MGQISFSSSSFGNAQKGNRPVAEVSLVAKGFELFWLWQERHRGRANLIGMPDGMLKDIGLSRGDAESEYEKPFWRS
ncbi:MAG TPA: DUF1127 domain-containing protein [Terriglobales bacterium]|nr:DUF1127 domain-containing protein [Terriglobales bacterium]